MTKKKRPKTPEPRKTYRLLVAMTEEQRATLEAAAAKDGRDVTGFIRFYAMEKARAILGGR